MEWSLFAQTAIPALMFIPSLGSSSVVKMVGRVASYLIALAACGAVLSAGRRVPGRPFPAVPWIAFCSVWFCLSLANPTTNSFLSGSASLILNLAILSPVFWAPASVRSTRQLLRLLTIMFVCNAAGTVMGILQVYRPGQFDPPVIPILEARPDAIDSFTFTGPGGRKILRPCGLTDSPGGACMAGAYTCLIGLAWALRPIRAWKQAACFLLAMAGMGVIYFSQVRSVLLVTLICQFGMAGILFLKRDFKTLSRLLLAAGILAVGALGWVLRSGGLGALERFMTLLDQPSGQLYYQNRGIFLESTFRVLIWEYPLGAGLGRWGMPFYYFGDKNPSADHGELYSEIQPMAWILDGGIPLLLAYSIAMALAIWNAVQIALKSRDPELSHAAMLISGFSLSTVAACGSGMPFIGPGGVQFWVMLGALHGAAAYQSASRSKAKATPPRPLRGRSVVA